MSSVYNPESERIAEIERLERDARDLRRRLEQARNAEDKRVIERQISEVRQKIDLLRSQLP
jgi:predicted RNase H-like nuclease (RuvC/YqgF family)